MKRYLISLIAAAMCASAASAYAGPKERTFTVSFTFDKTAPVEQTYSDLKRLVRKSCNRQASGVIMSYRAKFGRICRADLTNRLVDATKMPALIAYHDDRSSKSGNWRRFATRQGAGGSES